MQLTTPELYSSYRLDDIPESVRDLFSPLALDTRAHIENGSKVLIYGPEGSGKTTAMAALHNTWVSMRWQAWWLDCFDFPDNYSEADEVREVLSSAPIVCIDDLGKEPDRMTDKMVRLLASRARCKGITIITTNLAVDEEVPGNCALAQRYGFSLRSRILGSGEVVFYDGPDLRLTEK